MPGAQIEQAVILAAGRGMRLGSLTADRPKSLLPVAGRPILARVMERLWEAGIRRFVIVVGRHEAAVRAALGASFARIAEIRLVVQAEPTGTADALALARSLLDGPFVLAAVDNITPASHIRSLIARFEKDSNSLATLSLIPASPEEIRQSAGVTVAGEWIAEVVEKPDNPPGQHAAIMIYAFSPRVFDWLPLAEASSRGERELVNALAAALRAGERVGYALADGRLHLTSPGDLLVINRCYLQESQRAHVASALPASARLVPPVWIDAGVRVGEEAVIGPNVYVESGAAIGRGARLRDAVVLSGGAIPALAACEEVVIDRHATYVVHARPEAASEEQ
jgi:bifunctional UDP-N-acetylglucosamine pyrophosphorylase/glucosamine-1-phosphate N-acetyltransferase